MLLATKLDLACPVKGVQVSLEHIVELTAASFEADVLKAEGPVLVLFWATRSAPSEVVMPALEEIANTYRGRLKVGRVDIDSNPETQAKLGIRRVPTAMLFKNGNVKANKVGVTSQSELQALLDASSI
ncbi:MAG: thioredoxin family protein [Pseudonocardiaceae bacterium]